MVSRDGEILVLHHTSGVGTSTKGSYWIEIDSQIHGKLRQSYKKGGATELTFRFEAPASLVVQVEGAAGTRYEGRVRVSAYQETKEPNRFRGGRGGTLADAAGKATIGDIQPGRYKITATIGERHMGMVVAEMSATLRKGENTVTLDLPALHVVTFEGVQGSLWVQLEGEGGPQRHRAARATEDGRIVLDALPSGDYTARTGTKSKKFSLPGASTVDLR